MAMELLDGESLRERLMREGALRPELVLDWAAQVADGLAEAHDAQVVHRDLKPENIFLTKKGEVRVLDFGTAKFEGMGMPKTAHTERMGTVPYMSPEHLADDDVDARSDVYSLGIILYEMLAGRHPFANPDGSFPPLQHMVPMMLAGDPATLAQYVGEPVWQLVHRAIQSNRAYRFSSMREMAHAMRAVRAQITGSDQRGPIRLSGNSGGYPPTAPLPTPATPPTGTNFANQTPPPLAASNTQQVGVTGGALAAMAVIAALLGAVVVVLVMRGGSTHETDEPAEVHPASEPKEEPPPPKEETPPQPKQEEPKEEEPVASATASATPPPVPARPTPPASRPAPKAAPPSPPPPPAPGKELF